MKQLFIFIVAAFSLFSCNESAENHSKTSAPAVAENKIPHVEVLDFYGTHRCVTCEAIEANAKYTVESFFADEMKAGKVVFKTINVDEEANWDMAEKFEATGTALFLNVVNDKGVEEHINLTEFAFDKGRDKEAFSTALKSKIAAQLKKL